ncbi:hypothetical protein H0X32_04380 [Patescibacteria group bacterium]|nr:hypothetical protein [Patescibacteria group bacterium]
MKIKLKIDVSQSSPENRGDVSRRKAGDVLHVDFETTRRSLIKDVSEWTFYSNADVSVCDIFHSYQVAVVYLTAEEKVQIPEEAFDGVSFDVQFDGN